jgi:hypothetical protein
MNGVPLAPPTPADLVLGPVLRRVAGDRATVWVQVSRPATVEVRAGPAAGAARTFCAYGQHYGFVVVEGLPPAAATPYRVLLDGVPIWPPPGYPYPAPVIRTRPPRAPVQVVFGSCRESTPLSHQRYPPDALDSFAVRLAGAGTGRDVDPTRWPDTLLLLGDQVYADEAPATMRRWLRQRARLRRRHPRAPARQVVDFTEYARLYLDSWADPDIRWLLSTVPSLMIFDDHEIIDDWNISAGWRSDIARQSWWLRRIRSGLASYWVYQHLGNLAPDELAADPVYAAVASTRHATEVLSEFGARADREPDGYRWSYALDLGRTRLVVLDNRCGRQLTPGRRAMLTEQQWTWFEASLAGEYDHLVIGMSLPWLLAPAIHHAEAASERFCESGRPAVARFAERVRRVVDLEHWAAFGRSFEAFEALLAQVGSGAEAPASITVLSGDVHHSYVARADLGADVRSRVHQVTCSPVHNRVPTALRPLMRFGWGAPAARLGRGLARLAGLPPPGVRWRRVSGPHFGNAIGQLVHGGRTARVTIERTTPRKTLVPAGDVLLAGDDPAGRSDLAAAQHPAS